MEDGNSEDGPPIIYILAGCIAGAIEAIATWVRCLSFIPHIHSEWTYYLTEPYYLLTAAN